MRLIIVSGNRMAGMGLATVAARCGFTVEVATPDNTGMVVEAHLVLLYCDAWDETCRRCAAILHENRVPFLVITPGKASEIRPQAFAAGAIYTFGGAHAEELGDILGNIHWSSRPFDQHHIKLANGFTVDLARHRVYRGDRYMELSPTECGLLTVLYDESRKRPNQPVPPRRIALALWGSAGARSMSTLRSHISQLRGKIERDGQHPTLLHCRRGRGYWLESAISQPNGRPA